MVLVVCSRSWAAAQRHYGEYSQSQVGSQTGYNPTSGQDKTPRRQASFPGLVMGTRVCIYIYIYMYTYVYISDVNKNRWRNIRTVCNTSLRHIDTTIKESCVTHTRFIECNKSQDESLLVF